MDVKLGMGRISDVLLKDDNTTDTLVGISVRTYVSRHLFSSIIFSTPSLIKLDQDSPTPEIAQKSVTIRELTKISSPHTHTHTLKHYCHDTVSKRVEHTVIIGEFRTGRT